MLNPCAAHDPSVLVALADTPASQQLHHRLRYKVYCRKLGYEDPEQFPDGEERDQHDEHAVQFVAYDRRYNDWAGTLRLVRPNPAGLPLTSVTGLAPEIHRLMGSKRVLEISRLCVDVPTSVGGNDGRRQSYDPASSGAPAVFFALVRASVAYAFEAGISHLAFLTTASLIRLLKRLGIHHVPAGEACIHRGVRYPRVLDVAEQFRNLIEQVSAHPLATQLPTEPYQAYSSLQGLPWRPDMRVAV